MSEMHPTVAQAHRVLNERYFAKWEYYGTVPIPPDDNFGFMLEGSSATFSISTCGGVLPEGVVDFQIEDQEQYYLYTDELRVDEFFDLIPVFFKPIDEWPLLGEDDV